MNTIEAYAKKWNRDVNNNFAVACYNENTIEELQAPHTPADYDPTDCFIWTMTPEEWSEGIRAALNERINDEKN